MRTIHLCGLFLLLCLIEVSSGQRLRGRIRGSTYRRDMREVPPGSASLAFVFDVTGSMWDDLVQVIAGAKKILDTTLGRQEQPLFDYILIPFHDPIVGPITVTSNGELFQKKLRDLFVQGGGDCPEMSLTAIEQALELSLPSSFIYVFTDASAKDYYRLKDVLRVIQRKQSQVVFVLTGDCNNRDSPGYKAYEKIAATSSGQVFIITKSDVSEVVKFIEVSVQAHKVVLLATDHDQPGDRTWEIPFDPELKEVTLSLSGPDRRLRLFNPHGHEMTERDGLETLLDLETVLILNIKNASAGYWRVSAYSSGEHSLRVTGLSSLDFQARFSRLPTLDWSIADYQPIADAETHVLLNATGLPPPGEFREISLRDIRGDNIQEITLDPPPDPGNPYLYAVRPLLTPSQDFYIYVQGVTHEGYPFQRTTKNAILNVEPVAPSVYMKPTHPAYFDYPAEIPCEVSSLIPYHVTWSRKVDGRWRAVGRRTLHQVSSTVYLNIPEITDESEGSYRCVANNSKGLDYGETFLDVEERPPSIRVDGNVTVEPGKHAILTCHIKSKVKFTVSWSRLDGRAFDITRVRMLSNNSLAVTRARPDDEGGYKCTARNKGGTANDTVFLTVQAEPEVLVRPLNPVQYVVNQIVSLRCIANGHPDPSIAWLNGTEFISQDKHVKIRRGGTELRFIKAQQEHAGIYTCQATNKAGSASDTGRLIYTESPHVSLDEDRRLVLEGQSTEFNCHVTGEPKPRIAWYFLDGNQIVNNERHQISDDGVLTVRNLQTSDTGEYTCQAVNTVGRDSDAIFLQVGTIPRIVLPPIDTGIDIGNAGKLPCAADGYPAPEITWSKLIESTEEEEDNGDGVIVGVFEIVIGQENDRVYHDLNSNSLIIKNMEMEDVGLYTCSAANQFGGDAKSAEVDITGLVKPWITLTEERPHVIIGQSIALPCRITSGNPTPSRQWRRDSRVFDPTGRISVSQEGSVVITQAQSSDAGEYVCIAKNVAGEHSTNTMLDVWVPPSISTPETDYTTIEERSITLRCETSGNPVPTVQWTKAGVRGPLRYLPDYRVLRDYSLVISSPSPEHSGDYTCTATNAAGTDSMDAHLIVYYKPRTRDGSLDLYTVVQGDSITLDCPVTKSNPPPTFSWSFEGIDITHRTGQYEISDDGKLRIFSAQVSDDGQYTCTAVNEAGSVSHKMSLVVQVPPRILRGPSIIRGLEGEDIGLRCEATGIPLPKIRWRKNDVEVTSTGRLSLTHSQTEYSASSEIIIHPARLTDDGDFICIARNVAGRDTSITSLDVQKRPTIQDPGFGRDLTPSKGTHVTIPCVAYGDPSPTIRWFHNGEELTGDELDIDIASNGSLLLYSVDGDDSGSYKCEAENNLGKVDIETKITVYEPPEITDAGDTTRLWVFEGQSVSMFCYATAVPKPTITWYKVESSDRILNNEVDHINILGDGDILNITRARVSDTGRYYCAAANVEGKSYKFYELDVYVLPSIDGSDEVDRSKVILGNDFTLECPVTGIPFPTIRWFKGLHEISVEDEGMLIDNRGQSLTVLNSELEHDGEYTCVADNAVGEADKDFDVSILVPPTIAGDDMTHTIQVTRYLAIECRASGIPKPTLSWYKDGRTVAIINNDLEEGPQTLDNGRYLEFSRIRVEDEGVYKCVATNEAGSDDKTHTVNVQVPPKFSGDDIPANVSVVEGEDITLTCYASGDPPPTITWLKNGVLIKDGGRFSISDSGTFLTINNAAQSDRGQYTCRATNDVGVITQNQFLDVLVPPRISGNNENIVIEKGDPVALDCVISGNPKPKIRWEKDGLPVLANDRISFDFDKQRLIIRNSDETDTANYTCTASNIIGSDSKGFKLDVHVPPVVRPFDQDVYEVIEGEKIQITCVVSGIPQPIVRWLRDGSVIARSKYFKLREDGHTLVIQNADVGIHEGRYTCSAINDAGEDEQDLTVSVLIPPSIYGQEKTVNKIVNEGNEVGLECRVREGKPSPIIRWYRGESNAISKLSTSWDHAHFDQTITNLRAKVDNTGGYWCEAVNTAGRARKNFTIDVQVKPYIDGNERENKNVILDNDVSFTCKVSGVPRPEITWTKDGNPISYDLNDKYGTEKIGIGTYILTVNDAQDDDKGRYTCIATNDAGQDSKDFDLDVYLPPTHGGDGIFNITVLENNDAELFCDVEAFPKPTIRWYKDGQPVILPREVLDSLEDYRILPIKKAQISDAGLYKCEAENVAGITEKNFRLNVHSKPKVFGPTVDDITKLVGDRIDMVCDIRGVPAPTLSWTKNGQPLVIDESEMTLLSGSKILRIFAAELSDTGQFECHGINVAGRAVKSFDVTIHESSRILGDPHEMHDVNKGDTFTLECLVSGTPRPEITWFKDGHEVHTDSRTKMRENRRYLIVKNSHEADAGRYVCNASNVEAYDTKAYTVNVRVPPAIEDGPNRKWVKEGHNINLTCNAVSNSAVQIQWLFEGEPIIPSSLARPSPQGKRLMLFNVQREKAGQYTCRATNAAGSDDRNIILDVYTIPVITDSDTIDTYNVTRSESVTLECDVSGFPEPTIEWLKDFYPIFFHEDGSAQTGSYEIQNGGRLLTLFNAQVFDEGKYKCRATNEAGFDTKEYDVNIFVPPEIYRDGLREEVIVREKSYIRIQCAASGIPAPKIRWLKDGEPYVPRRLTPGIDQDRFLTFQSVEEDDGATYSCVAENPAGRDLVDVNIIVNVPPKIRGSENPFSTTVEVVVGETLDLECEVIRGTPEPQIEWWKRSNKIIESDHIKILAEGRYLRIPQARSDDYGVYTCVAKNVEGVDSKAYNVLTLEPPRFASDKQDEIDVVLGFSHFIICEIDAQPQPRLEWFKDGQPLNTDRNVQVDQNGRVLFIKSARLEDRGIYMCKARNKAGTDEKLTKINILTPPSINEGQNDNDVDVLLERPTYLNCTVQGYPQPTITWFRNGIRVDLNDDNFETFDNGQILSIASARLIDSGRYDCHARNTAGRDRKDFRLNVQVAPTISGPKFEEYIMLEGRYYELDCFSSGIPDPTNEWFKDGDLVRRGHRYSQFHGARRLGIYSADERDNGLFVCTATNVAGMETKTFNVSVYMSPRLTDSAKYKDLVVNQGKEITLNCESNTFPKPSVTWIKNGEELPESHFAASHDRRIKISKNGFLLTIFDAEPEDAALYSCELLNDAGATSRKFNLKVNRPPVISGPDTENIKKPIDSTISMDCSVQGSPAPEIIWLKNGLPVEFSERVHVTHGQNTLRIDRSVERDMGIYTCIAKNVAGEDSKDFDVDILVPPLIDKSFGPDNIDAILGEEVSLACIVAAGNPIATVDWYKEGELVTEDQAQVLESGQLLLIPSVKTTDAGGYTCIAKNGIGQDDRSFDINVLIPPSIGFRSTFNHVEVNETFDAILECDVMGGQPPPEITWTHDDVPIRLGQRIKTFADGKRLEIYRALTSDTGVYKCTATNVAGTVMDRVRLDVYVPPAFESPNTEDITLIEGEPLFMDCTVYGIPEPDLAWTVSTDGEVSKPLITERVRYLNKNQAATIDESRVDDTGLYSCIVSSISGNAQKLFNVTVQVPPSIIGPKSTDTVRVIEGNSFDLDCPVSGVPMPEVIWLKNGRPLPLLDVSRIRNNGQQLHIESAQLNDIGTYTCVAKSDAGEANRNFEVDVIVPPSSSGKGVNITAVTGSDVKLECKSDAIPPPTFNWLKNGRPIGHYSHLLLLKNVQVTDTAVYMCEAVNEAGKSVRNMGLTVYKKPIIAPGPSEVITLVHETIKLMCIVDGVPQPEVSWWKDSHEISSTDAEKYRFVGDSLELIDLQLDDKGEYMCLATNNAGSDQRKINLIVQEPPTIGRGPTNITVLANTPVTLPCEVSGTPQPLVRWLKNSHPYYPSQKLGYRQLEIGSLQISAASVQDMGLYTCNVENDAGSIFRDINLIVQVPPSIANTISKYIVQPFTRVRIPCDVSGIPKPSVTWTRDGISADQLIGVYMNPRDNSLDIPSVGTLHEATYTCTAENPAGQATYDAEVKVQTAPVIANPTQSVTALEGTTTTLSCEATGTPEPVVNWRRGTQIIEMDERHEMDSNNGLRISNVQVSDSAKYTCVAQNVAGTAFGKVKLDVHVLPKILTDLKPNMVAIAGQPFTFPISTTGKPKPAVGWSKDGYELLEDDSHYVKQDDGSLLIPIVLPGDAGRYNVTAFNDAGSTSIMTQLDVIVPPDLRALASEITVTQGSQIPLDIVADGNPLPEITWTKDGEPLNPDDERVQQLSYGSLIINNAMSTDTGYYTATAINDGGRDSIKIKVTVQVPPIFTVTPENQKKQSGDDMSMVCAAVGFPTPTITWKFNDQVLPAQTAINDAPGSSLLFIENVRSQDSGDYVCQASNQAGIIAHLASVTVDSPPVFTNEHDPDVYARLGTTARLDCPVSSNPAPTITWTKDGRELSRSGRYEILSNGSLIIYHTEENDAGDYKCVATNEAGSIDRTTKLILELAPSFLTRPSDTVAVSGSNVIMNCAAHGVPTPNIQWRKSNRALPTDGRFTVLHNNSLQIATIQLEDTGQYSCIATNEIGSRMAKASLVVKVHGQFGEWKPFGACSTTCGTGSRTRIRFCNSPPPANGGNDCVKNSEDSTPCEQGPCPVNGGWGEYGSWEPCSVTCGQGHEMRLRECSNPTPQYGGLPCSGDGFEKRLCRKTPCGVDGGWSKWSAWLPCSATCDEGVSVRNRACNNPAPTTGGRKCEGSDTMSRICNLKNCPVNGNWGTWAAFSICSVSCGGGTRDRIRTCSNPAPGFGGELCPGSNIQLDNCNAEPCPVNGNWGSWGVWSSCSQSCGGGQRRKYRSCAEPRPRYGGRYCPGTDVTMQSCGLIPCPEDGGWSEWSEWTPCLVTCGSGIRNRKRTCTNPVPQYNGKFCDDDSTQTDQCSLQPCPDGPRTAIGTLYGNVNDVPIIGSSILSHGTPIGDDKVRVVSVIKDIPKAIGEDLRNQVSILTPIYWTFAKEIEGAYNGHTLTGGNFERHVNVEFPSGQLVEMFHDAKGIDKEGNLVVDIQINGDVPMFPPDIDLSIKDYFEDYIQTGPDSLYAFSDRFYTINNEIMLYTWNHSIYYDESHGVMPYLVEQLFGTDIVAKYDPETLELMFQIDVTIGKGDPSNECPHGFVLDPTGQYCNDEDECNTRQPCSHICHNLIGSYSCECPDGFHIGMDGDTCKDIDECEESSYDCEAPYVCKNTRGSYRCEITCGPGLLISEDGQHCTDINECEGNRERICEHICNNTYGSFRCSCRLGYQRSDETSCEDIDECTRGACYGDITQCHNTAGSYFCTNSCPAGFYLNQETETCLDIDECGTEELNRCDHLCENVDGSYRCLCNDGYTMDRNSGLCIDRDECADGRGPCQYGCANLEGTYRCFCPKGYRLSYNEHSCEDIDECKEGLAKCVGRDVMCANSLGDFRCVNTRCPPNYKRHNGICTRDCLGDECENKFKSVIRYNSTYLRVGVPKDQDLLELAVSYTNPTGSHQLHSNTIFRLLTPAYDRAYRLFGLRVIDDERGIVYTKQAITRSHIDWYKLRVSARSRSSVDGSTEYETIFSLFINVAPNPFV
ncbi:hemicentin-1-like [Styela clava]